MGDLRESGDNVIPDLFACIFMITVTLLHAPSTHAHNICNEAWNLIGCFAALKNLADMKTTQIDVGNKMN